jgi:hypothetical protein
MSPYCRVECSHEYMCESPGSCYCALASPRLKSGNFQPEKLPDLLRKKQCSPPIFGNLRSSFISSQLVVLSSDDPGDDQKTVGTFMQLSTLGDDLWSTLVVVQRPYKRIWARSACRS